MKQRLGKWERYWLAAQTSAHGGHLKESITLEACDALVKSQVNTLLHPILKKNQWFVVENYKQRRKFHLCWLMQQE